MSIALVIETQQEVRRLLIAGSEMAKEDFRLQKILPALKASGAKAPIFARIAAALETVINASGGKTAENLLELANLVNAVLYTQGESGITGELQIRETAGFNFTTRIALRRLQPVKEALTSTGSGRLEVIDQAYQDGIFKDLRLIEPLLGALDDAYGEVANLAYRILKEYGAEIVPILLKKLDLQGGKRSGRLVDLLAEFLGKQGKEFYLQWSEQGAIEVKAAAIRALKDLPECEAILLEFSQDKKKELREAAYQALAYQDSPAAVQRLYEVFQGKDWRAAIEPLRTSKVGSVAPFLLQEAEQLLEALLAKDEATLVKADTPAAKKEAERLAAVLICLEGKEEPAALQFYQKCLTHALFLNKLRRGRNYDYYYSNDAESLAGLVANTVLHFGTVEAYRMLDQLEGKYHNCLLGWAFAAALHYRTAEEVFERYSSYLKKGKKAECREIIKVLERYVDYASGNETETGPVNPNDATTRFKFDYRWCKMLIVAQETELVSRFVQPGDRTAIHYLLQQLENHLEINQTENQEIVRGLIQAQYEKVDETVLRILRHNFQKNSYSLNWYLGGFVEALKGLSAESARWIADFAKEYHNEAAAKLFDLAQYLKEKPQAQ
jgi:hypothetical protein